MNIAALYRIVQPVSSLLPTRTLDEVRFHSPVIKGSYLTKREADILLSPMDKQVTDASSVGEENLGVYEARRRVLAGALAARDHAVFSDMIYAGLRIEESTALKVEDLSFTRGEVEVRVGTGKGNKERVVPMSLKLRRSLKRYLKVHDELVPARPLPPRLSERGGRAGDGKHLETSALRLGAQELHKEAGRKAPRPEEDLRDVVFAGQPRACQGIGGTSFAPFVLLRSWRTPSSGVLTSSADLVPAGPRLPTAARPL
jgi:integrase